MSLFKNIKNYEYKILSFILAILPISLIFGSAASNTLILVSNFYFIYEIYKKKQINFIINKTFFIFISVWVLLMLNSILIANNYESFIRSFGFLRFILLIYTFKYCFENINENLKKTILGVWFIIFIIVTIDVFIEFYTGANILGTKSAYNGRIASFTGDELKIGNYYYGFILLTLSYYYKNYYKNYKIFFYILAIIFIITSFLIGERSNFIKVFLICSLFIFLINNKDFIKKIFILSGVLLITSIITLNNDFYKSRVFNEILIPIKEKGALNFIQNTRYGKHYELAENIFKQNYVFGVGIKNYRNESKKDKYQTNNTLGSSTTHPHQIHYEFLSETGIVGYIIFIIFFAYSIIFGFKFNFESRDPFVLASTLFITATILPLIPSGSFFTSYGASIFWINYSFLLIRSKKF